MSKPGANSTFIFEKQGQIRKHRKTGAKSQLALRIGVETPMSQYNIR
jgi:hypothetical protein